MIYDDPFHRVPRGFDSCNAICAVLHAHDSELHLRVQGRTPVRTISLPAPDCQVWHEHKWLQRFQTKYENIREKQDGLKYPRLLPNGYRKLWKHIEPLQYSEMTWRPNKHPLASWAHGSPFHTLHPNPSRSSQILEKRRTRQMKPSLSLRLSQTSSPSFTLWKSTCTRPNGL